MWGPLPPVASTRAKPRLSPRTRGWGTKDLGPQGPGTPRAISWEVWGPFNKTLKASKGSERCVQTLNHPLYPSAPMGCAVHGHGVSWGQPPEGLQGLLCHPGAFTSQTGPGISPPAQLRACFDFYSQFYGRTPGALWAEASLLW